MKKITYLLLFVLIGLLSCKKTTSSSLESVVVQLAYPSGSVLTVHSGTKVKLTSGSSSYTDTTNSLGIVSFSVPVGIYEVSATDTTSSGGKSYIYNGLTSGLAITASRKISDTVKLSLTESSTSQVVIKEIYTGGTPKDDGSGTFIYDKYVILYNNSSTVADLGNTCLGMISPYNAQATNSYYGTDGKLSYESAGWIPAVQGFWYFKQDVTIEPYSQIVIALNNAVNNTLTYSKSINFDNSAYYATYDISKFTNTTYYVTPAASIPTSHYLTAAVYGAGNAWAVSTTSPGIFIFTPEGTTPASFAADASLTNVLSAYTSKEVPVSWVVDGVECYLLNNTSNKKRFTSSIDAGYVYFLNGQGYSVYRNVNKTATEALTENAGKIVYNYAYGTTSIGGTTDPSGIDAEASIKKGAHIIYMDTNNSTNDFHLRSQASLRN